LVRDQKGRSIDRKEHCGTSLIEYLKDMNLHDEIVKGVITCTSGLIIVLSTAVCGGWVAFLWNTRQKIRETQLAALQQFYIAYGEFFSIWKLWNPALRDRTKDEARYQTLKWELHKRSAAAEAIVEGTLVKLASELTLSPVQIDNLGCFRQAFQQLRQAVRFDKELPWRASVNDEYVAFKMLAVRVAGLLTTSWPNRRVPRTKASEQLLEVTANAYEDGWSRHPSNLLS
jgi:hypothetical protein